ncbi:MAG: C25 family cysteine peptidase [Candidatus Cloacimonadaceae bacterium]|jgi:hypothetical protein|nr:C25 family cysteine peptidase [Candidatus Cloacimonadaceae bacterium]
MKRLALLLILSLICGLAIAAGAEYAPESHKSAFKIQSQTTRQMEINFNLPEFEVYEQTQGADVYHRIMLPTAGTTMQSGLPELPVITTTIAIPHRGGVEIEVLNSEQTVLTQFHAYPLQQGQELESPKAFQKNIDFYSSGGNYPSAAIEYSNPMILRDFRIVTIQINPFSYNPTTQELTIHNNILLRANFTDEPSVNELAAPTSYVSASFDKIYSSMIQNYDDYRDMIIANTPPRYLIIHGNTTDNTFLTALDNYVLWKRQKGAEVNVANTSSSQAGSSTSSIQTYIRNQYNNPSTRPDFVILIGDTSGSFSIPADTNNNGGTDYDYTHMNPGDYLGDIFIGRISVENTNQFLVVLNKIYLYERDMDLDTAQWLNHMMLAGDNDPSGISTMYISKYIKEMAQEVNHDYTFTEQYGSNFSSMVPTINAAFNQGIGFYSYRGYIDFSPPSESALFNAYKLPHTVIITCATGNYSNSLGETEQLIRYGTTAAPKGSVTAIGMSTSSTHTTFNNVLHGAIFEGVFTYGMRTMGEALLHGRLYMNDMFGVSSPVNAEKFAHWCNLMGDPTMEVYTGIPNHFMLDTDANIPLGLTLLDVAVTDSLGVAVEGAAVVLSQDSNILAKGFTDIDGNVVLSLPVTMVAGDAKLTVSKHNFKPLQSDIEIVDIATLVPAAIVIDDDNTGASTGNDNGIATAGESLEIYFGLLNTGTETIDGITGTLSSNSPWINIVQGNITYPAILGGATGNNLTPIVIEVAPNTPHETLLRLQLTLTDNQSNEYQVSELIEVEAARIEFESLSIVDDQNFILDPDETVGLNITLINHGATEISNIYARLYTDNDLVSITDNTAWLGTLPLDTPVSTTNTDMFVVWQRPETLPGMVMPLSVKLYNDEGFEQIIPFTLTVGSVSSTDPLGPDTYGYVIYDWTDADYPEAAIYDWFEIAPQLGGLGTPVPITDSYNSGDEGDQVGAQSVATVDLPFPFQFYGRLYDQVTICSNGFLAMGVTENGEFRNFRLPGAMGPSPMIAPFWDDLATHSGGGIYTYFDRNNHSFIVEWYNLKNGKNGSSIETFQAILYDQATYNTSLGDGPIKFQYHTFNNVNSQSGNNHGNYCTIGIEDHSGIRGLEYSFNNTYPSAAVQLSDGKALYITNVPTYYEAANLLIEQTYINDSNNVVEPGETVKIGVKLQNSGNVEATTITSVLSTDDPYITMINAESDYFDLDPGSSGVNRSPFEFSVAADCPANRIISFDLAITSGEVTWNRIFSVHVEANQLQYHSFMTNDYEGNFNGVVEAGEQIQLIINLQNASAVEARNVEVNLTSEMPNLVISNPTFTISSIDANQIMQAVFNLDFSDASPVEAYLPMNFSASPDNGESINVQINLPYNLPNIENDFELDDGGFDSETGWTWGTPVQVTPPSGDKVWGTNLSGQYPSNVTYQLYSPLYTLSSESNLSFMHYYDTELGYDGVNFAISTDHGQNWTLLVPAGGYPDDSIDALGNAPGWTGSSNNWLSASFDLTSYSNQEVMFRFRLGTNGAVGGAGWFIDDFELTGVNLKTGFLHGTIYPSSGADPSSATVMSNQRLCTHANSEGYFRLYLNKGMHSATAGMPFHQNSTQNNIQITIENPVVETEFTLIDLPTVANLSYNVDNDTGIFEMMWSTPEDPVLPISAYRIYRKFDSGPYELAVETTELNYIETFVLEGAYRFYITPMYLNVEGSPSQVVYAPFPYVSNEDPQIPALVTALDKNFPNPFNPTTTIRFSLAEAGAVSLNVYNTKGQLVRQLARQDMLSGKHQIVWDGRDDRGNSVASGLYFYRMQSGKYVQSRKMILMK